MIKVIWGSNKEKPIASRQLADFFTAKDDLEGYLYIGYPIIGSPTGPMKFDALLLSEQKGIIAFDLVEGTVLDDYKARQDEIASMLDVKLKPYDTLKRGRHLKFEINTVTFSPAIKRNLPESDDLYHIGNNDNLSDLVNAFEWTCDNDTFKSLLAAIQVVTNIRAGRLKRSITSDNSLGARLKKLEDSIANLDQHQSEAVIETVDGVQRIRGLAGSGKTIVLALKVAYLHAQNPDWKIAVTFHTRALKEQLKRLINNFTIEQIGTEPDWERIDIVNSWGAPGSIENDGIYHKFCKENMIDYFDFSTAKNSYGNKAAFENVCKIALNSVGQNAIEKYDVILIDEAQDFPADFLRLCYAFLKEPKRLVYAYDELQSLNGQSVLPPDELFGKDEAGNVLVTLVNDDPTKAKQDIILEKCYRNSRPLLATAHALGFGLNRSKGLVQFFDNDSLWEEVGYSVADGELVGGENVELIRTPESSPCFLEEHTAIEDLIQFKTFNSKQEMDNQLVEDIENNITKDELRPEDIVVINPDPLTTQNKVGVARASLLHKGIKSEIAGVTTSRDIFSQTGSVTFTGIFRAKGNEAGMVYIINGQDCFDSFEPNQLALIRNRLFTAITRSKAWVRVYGIGPNMDALTQEWNTLSKENFALKFKYPTDKEKTKLKLINRDMTIQERTKQRRLTRNLGEILEALSKGELPAELIPDDTWEQLKKLKR
ncbi:DEAD/DEAH box helicase [Aliivibrio fischeri]|uniref:DEAD/DEAH box helicase n=1 Tax=Aliivibrio fischeri TaxID=668 RepID=UPI00080E5989|nr:ATP-binding domain-containing protein [Aliivibrio fischeri]OCH03331.1 helicase [Aliivibrio fischeri]